jgi:hypothetical protein
LGGSKMLRAEQHQEARGAERKGRGDRDDAARRRQRRLERHDHEPDRGEGADAAGRHATTAATRPVNASDDSTWALS